MRFLHTADLHLGRQMNDLSLMQDQEYILDRIAELAESERVDAVLIAGDVYQRSSPQAEAMALFDSFISRLVSMKKRVFMISGNHDSTQRISYFSSILRSSGVYVTEKFEGRLQCAVLRDAFGEIAVWMLPFLRPSGVRRCLPEERIRTYQDAVEAVLRNTPVDPSMRNVLVCHQFITGSEASDSEELAVGGLENIDASVFDAFDYVALGHIHKPQTVGRDTLRYAGSPLKYSFSEVSHRKSVTIVDVEQKGETSVHTVPLQSVRDVRCVTGTMAELSDMPYSEDYVWVTVCDELVPPDARVALSVTFPNMLKFSVVNSKTKSDTDVMAGRPMENKSVTELFEDFYRLQNNDRLPGESHRKVLEKVLRELEGRE